MQSAAIRLTSVRYSIYKRSMIFPPLNGVLRCVNVALLFRFVAVKHEWLSGKIMTLLKKMQTREFGGVAARKIYAAGKITRRYSCRSRGGKYRSRSSRGMKAS